MDSFFQSEVVENRGLVTVNADFRIEHEQYESTHYCTPY